MAICRSGPWFYVEVVQAGSETIAHYGRFSEDDFPMKMAHFTSFMLISNSPDEREIRTKQPTKRNRCKSFQTKQTPMCSTFDVIG